MTQKTYGSKKYCVNGLDHRDILSTVEAKGSAFNAYYIQNIKQTKRELSSIGSYHHGVASSRVHKRKYVKRLVMEDEVARRESASKSVFLTPDKSIHVNKAPDPFDLLLNSSPMSFHVQKASDPFDNLPNSPASFTCTKQEVNEDQFDKLLVERVTLSNKTNTRKKYRPKKFNRSDTSESNKENSEESSSVPQNVTDIKSHELLIEEVAKQSPKFEDSLHELVKILPLLSDLAKEKNSHLTKENNTNESFAKVNIKNRLTMNLTLQAPLSSTPFNNKHRDKSIYKYSPIPMIEFNESPDANATKDENFKDVTDQSFVFITKSLKNKNSNKRVSKNSKPLFSSVEMKSLYQNSSTKEKSRKTNPETSEIEPFLGFNVIKNWSMVTPSPEKKNKTKSYGFNNGSSGDDCPKQTKSSMEPQYLSKDNQKESSHATGNHEINNSHVRLSNVLIKPPNRQQTTEIDISSNDLTGTGGPSLTSDNGNNCWDENQDVNNPNVTGATSKRDKQCVQSGYNFENCNSDSQNSESDYDKSDVGDDVSNHSEKNPENFSMHNECENSNNDVTNDRTESPYSKEKESQNDTCYVNDKFSDNDESDVGVDVFNHTGKNPENYSTNSDECENSNNDVTNDRTESPYLNEKESQKDTCYINDKYSDNDKSDVGVDVSNHTEKNPENYSTNSDECENSNNDVTNDRTESPYSKEKESQHDTCYINDKCSDNDKSDVGVDVSNHTGENPENYSTNSDEYENSNSDVTNDRTESPYSKEKESQNDTCYINDKCSDNDKFDVGVDVSYHTGENPENYSTNSDECENSNNDVTNDRTESPYAKEKESQNDTCYMNDKCSDNDKSDVGVDVSNHTGENPENYSTNSDECENSNNDVTNDRNESPYSKKNNGESQNDTCYSDQGTFTDEINEFLNKPIVVVEKLSSPVFAKYCTMVANSSYNESDNSHDCNILPNEPIVAIEKLTTSVLDKYIAKIAIANATNNETVENYPNESRCSIDKSIEAKNESIEDERNNIYDTFEIQQSDNSNAESDRFSDDSHISEKANRLKCNDISTVSSINNMEDNDTSIVSSLDYEDTCFITTRRRCFNAKKKSSIVFDESLASVSSSECDKTVISIKCNLVQDMTTNNQQVNENVLMTDDDHDKVATPDPEHQRNTVTEPRISLLTTRKSVALATVPETGVDSKQQAIVLQPGKKWERCLSIYRRMTMVNDNNDQSILDDEEMHTKGRKFRQTVINMMKMQPDCKGTLHNDSTQSRRSTIVCRSSRSTIRIVKDTSNSRLSVCSTSTDLDELNGAQPIQQSDK